MTSESQIYCWARVHSGLLLVGCNTTYEMEVDAISTFNNGCGILHHNPAGSRDRYQRSTVQGDGRLHQNRLSGKGLYEALNAEEADMVVEIDYGMEPTTRISSGRRAVFATIQHPDTIQQVARLTLRRLTIVYNVRCPVAGPES